MQNAPKDFGQAEREMDVTVARDQHHALVTRLMTGPGGSESAMHRAERQFGLPYWAQFALRYKRRATPAFIARVREAYLSVLEQSLKKDIHELKTEQARGGADAGIEGLISEAEGLLSRIKSKSSA